MWQTPHPIDVTATEEVPTPKQWRDALPGQETVTVLRLAPKITGHRMPGWCVVGGEVSGPETEAICGGTNSKRPDYVGVWRQGNLLHFGFEPAPSELEERGRKLLLNGIDYIARFVSDRPIVRVKSFVDPDGGEPTIAGLDYYTTGAGDDPKRLAALFAAPWQERIQALDLEAARAFVQERRRALLRDGRLFTISELALDLGLDLREAGAVSVLVGQLEGERGDAAKALLLRLMPDGPGAETTPASWRNWLRARQRYLCHDPHALVFRVDALAQARRTGSAGLRGPARADGEVARDPAALAVATEVVAFHGGRRALEDLRTFSCRLGDVSCFWDRARGILRIENHGELPVGARAVPWTVLVFDAAADADLITGGGPPPRPTLSGRSTYRELVERLFLPLLLLDPGTTLKLLGEDGDGNTRLAVQVAGRGLEPRKTHVLCVAPTGAVVAYDYGPSAAARSNLARITATTHVGPLLLPTAFTIDGHRRQEVAYTDAAWNPEAPAGLADAEERLLR